MVENSSVFFCANIIQLLRICAMRDSSKYILELSILRPSIWLSANSYLLLILPRIFVLNVHRKLQAIFSKNSV